VRKHGCGSDERVKGSFKQMMITIYSSVEIENKKLVPWVSYGSFCWHLKIKVVILIMVVLRDDQIAVMFVGNHSRWLLCILFWFASTVLGFIYCTKHPISW